MSDETRDGWDAVVDHLVDARTPAPAKGEVEEEERGRAALLRGDDLRAACAYVSRWRTFYEDDVAAILSLLGELQNHRDADRPGSGEGRAALLTGGTRDGNLDEVLRYLASRRRLDPEEHSAVMALIGELKVRRADDSLASSPLPSPKGMGEPGHPEDSCERCGQPNVALWHAPSPLWNAVMRDMETGLDAYEIVCPRCFAAMAEAKGIFAEAWCFRPHGIDVASLWSHSDGMRWDDRVCLWVSSPSPAETQATGKQSLQVAETPADRAMRITPADRDALCSVMCPNTKKSDEPWPHVDLCARMTTALGDDGGRWR